MSADLLDEIEALNAIFSPPSGPPTLSPTTTSPTSSLPFEAILTPPPPTPLHPACASLRIIFPPTYPSQDPPDVRAPHSAAGSGRRGDATLHLELFRRAVAQVFTPGNVCLYDAIEEFGRLLLDEEEKEKTRIQGGGLNRQEDDGGGGDAGDDGDEEGKQHLTHGLDPAAAAAAAADDEIPTKPPPWIVSDPVVERGSTFIARVAPVTSPAQASRYVRHLIVTDKRVSQATHNMTAWRIRGAPGAGTSFQDCDDDGETAAGSRLLRLMQLMDLWDVMVVVSRWYGGHKLGPRRFALINSVARDGFVKAGLVVEGEKSGGKKRGGH